MKRVNAPKHGERREPDPLRTPNGIPIACAAGPTVDLSAFRELGGHTMQGCLDRTRTGQPNRQSPAEATEAFLEFTLHFQRSTPMEHFASLVHRLSVCLHVLVTHPVRLAHPTPPHNTYLLRGWLTTLAHICRSFRFQDHLVVVAGRRPITHPAPHRSLSGPHSPITAGQRPDLMTPNH